MRLRAGRQQRGGRSGVHRFTARPAHGFTLLEVLLATILLLLLLGAVVFNFSSLEQGAKLDEGASQFESLLRYARAQAASSGRLVRLSFEEEVEPDFFVPLGTVRMLWEPDPLGRPGVFEDLPLARPFIERINELVQVDAVSLEGPGGFPNDPAADPAALDDATGSERAWFFPPINFYPDGSSDTAELFLISNDETDARRVRLRLAGVTGAVRRTTLEPDAADATESEPSDHAPTTRPSEPVGVVERNAVARPSGAAGGSGLITGSSRRSD